MKKIYFYLLMLMLSITSDGFSQQTSEERSNNENFIHGEQTASAIKKRNEFQERRDIENQRKSIANKVKKSLLEFQSKNLKVYKENIKRDLKSKGKSNREIDAAYYEFVDIYRAYIQNKIDVSSYLILSKGKTGYDEFMQWNKSDVLDVDIWKERCSIALATNSHCLEPAGTTEYKRANIFGDYDVYKLFY